LVDKVNFISFRELNNLSSNHDIFFFGCSDDWVPKTLSNLNFKPKFFIDNNKDLHGKAYEGVKVIPLSKFQKILSDKSLVIITSGSYVSILEDLKAININLNKIYFSPVFKDFYYLNELRSTECNVLFTSNDTNSNANRNSKYGGGVYLLNISETSNKLKKIYSGSCRQIVKHSNDHYLFIDNSGFLVSICIKSLKVINKFKIPRECCGLAYDEISKIGYFACTKEEKIYKFSLKSQKFKIEKFIHFKNNPSKNNSFHINDIYLLEDRLLCSYFSFSGFWRKGIFDGGCAVIDMRNGRVEKIYSDLMQPHSPFYFNGELGILESGTGKIYFNTYSSPVNFSGFIRGISNIDRSRLLIGQSETMYLSRVKSYKNNINMSAGFYLYDKDADCHRFISTPGICNIHDCKII